MSGKKEAKDDKSVERQPGILVVGSSSVGKRTLLSRLLSCDFEDASDSSSQLLVRSWTINTKYYTADVAVWMGHLYDGFSTANLPISDQLAALVMVFDTSDISSLIALKDWVSCNDIKRFDILLCIANKVDLVPGHPVHAEYRRRMLKLTGNSADAYSEIAEYGISEIEGSSLLEEEEPSWDIRKSCFEWCCEHNIEFIEACASSAEFDKCLSVDGDLQGVERLYGALSAHMWPGMILKSGDKISEPSLPEREEFSEEESDFDFEYEVLSESLAEQWDDTNETWVSANGINSLPERRGSVFLDTSHSECYQENLTRADEEEMRPSTSTSELPNEINKGVVCNEEQSDKAAESDEGTHFAFEDLEQLMSEIGNMRNNLRLMPDFQRREMAAKLALKMATMFGGNSDDEDTA